LLNLHLTHRRGSIQLSSSLQKKERPGTKDHWQPASLLSTFLHLKNRGNRWKTPTDENTETRTGIDRRLHNLRQPVTSEQGAGDRHRGEHEPKQEKTQGASRRINRDYTEREREREAERNTQTKKENRERDRERRDQEKRKKTQNTNSQDSILSLQRPYSGFIKARKGHREKSDHCLHHLQHQRQKTRERNRGQESKGRRRNFSFPATSAFTDLRPKR